MNKLEIESCDIKKYCSHQKKRYDLWVYDGGQILQVFEKETPNTKNVWFQFYSFSYLYWKLMEATCVQDVKGNAFYNFNKIKEFMLRYLLCGTNILNIVFNRQQDGSLTDQTFDRIMSIHPRILRAVFDLIDIFPARMSKKREKNLEKQCAILFGQGSTVTNPDSWISTYCNLVAFWDKFGLNYFDVLKLPNETFLMLKKIMGLENSFRNKEINEQIPKKNKGIKF